MSREALPGMTPIGTFRAREKELYQCPHQPMLGHDSEGSYIQLVEGQNFEQALKGLEGFSRIWVIFLFHGAGNWKPMVMPPRGERKIGCLATRSPHRPNSIGMSSLELLSIAGRKLYVGPHDILNGTPILDVKPYLPAVDSFPEARAGWTEEVELVQRAEMNFTEGARSCLNWLLEQGFDLWPLAETTLFYYPEPRKRKRTRWLEDGNCELSCKTWRIRYHLDGEQGHWRVTILDVLTGYPDDVLSGEKPSRWKDRELHLAYVSWKDQL